MSIVITLSDYTNWILVGIWLILVIIHLNTHELQVVVLASLFGIVCGVVFLLDISTNYNQVLGFGIAIFSIWELLEAIR